jgi:hypothetical protein
LKFFLKIFADFTESLVKYFFQENLSPDQLVSVGKVGKVREKILSFVLVLGQHKTISQDDQPTHNTSVLVSSRVAKAIQSRTPSKFGSVLEFGKFKDKASNSELGFRTNGGISSSKLLE